MKQLNIRNNAARPHRCLGVVPYQCLFGGYKHSLGLGTRREQGRILQCCADITYPNHIVDVIGADDRGAIQRIDLLYGSPLIEAGTVWQLCCILKLEAHIIKRVGVDGGLVTIEGVCPARVTRDSLG